MQPCAHMYAAMSELQTCWGQFPRASGRENNGIVLFVFPPGPALRPRPPWPGDVPRPVFWTAFLRKVLLPLDFLRVELSSQAPAAADVPLLSIGPGTPAGDNKYLLSHIGV